jgi:hypothetical protein
MRAKTILFFLLGLLVLSMIASCGVSVLSIHKISGSVTADGVGIPGVTVSLTGTQSATSSSSTTTTTDTNGNYSFGGLVNGGYTVTPTITGRTFTPSSSSLTIHDGDISGVNFTAGASTIAVSTLAGSGSAGFANGAGNSATFNSPSGIVTDGTNLYVADVVNNAIRKIAIATGQVTTLAGSGSAGFANGAGNSATFNSPFGVTTDGTNVFVADTFNNVIREIVIASEQVSTLAGTGASGFANGSAPSATFSGPDGIIISSDGTTLYVADTNNNAIRVIRF